jgi:hypothetical protein
MNNAMYIAAGVVVFVIILIVLNSVFPLWLLLAPKASAGPPAPKVSPVAVLTTRSDFARADYFTRVVLAPELQALNPALSVTSQQCTKQLTNSCNDALGAVEPLMKSTESTIDKASLPLCITPQVAKVRGDMNNMQSALDVAQSAYNHNQGGELAFAMGTFVKYRNVFSADAQALSGVAKSKCDTRETGP